MQETKFKVFIAGGNKKEEIEAICNGYATVVTEGEAPVGVRFEDGKVFGDIDAAKAAMEEMATGEAEMIAVPFKQYGEVENMIYTKKCVELTKRLEEATAKYEALAGRQHYSPETISAKTVTCKHCGAKYKVANLEGNICPNCKEDLRPKSVVAKEGRFKTAMEKLQVTSAASIKRCTRTSQIQAKMKPTKCWLVKMVYNV